MRNLSLLFFSFLILSSQVQAQIVASLSKKAIESFNNADYRQAIQAYTKVIEANPKDYMAYQYRGEAKSNLGEDKAAILDFDEALQLNPSLASAYGLRGDSKAFVGNDKGAIEDYTLGLKHNPKDILLYFHRATAKFNLQDYKGTIEDYTAFLAHSDEWYSVTELSDALINRGLAKEKLSDQAGACADWESALVLGGYDALGFLKKKCGK
jgi:tetratricopeptide (TPR) repeat protein